MFQDSVRVVWDLALKEETINAWVADDDGRPVHGRWRGRDVQGGRPPSRTECSITPSSPGFSSRSESLQDVHGAIAEEVILYDRGRPRIGNSISKYIWIVSNLSISTHVCFIFAITGLRWHSQSNRGVNNRTFPATASSTSAVSLSQHKCQTCFADLSHSRRY